MSVNKFNTEGYHDPTVYEALNNIEKEDKLKKYKKIVFICSPFAGDIEGNTRRARRYGRFAVTEKAVPVIPHLMYPQFLEEDDPDERQLGIDMGLILLSKCHELWVFGNRISSGMSVEIAKANVKRGPRKSYPLSGRLVCGDCGSNLHRYVCRGIVTWRCGHQTISRGLCTMKGVKEENIMKAILKGFSQRYENDQTTERRQVINLMKELQSTLSIRDAQQNQLRLELERALLLENNAIFKCEDAKEFTKKRNEIEKQIAMKESWWQMVDEDDVHRKKALDTLVGIKDKPRPAVELQVAKNSIEFLRGWVVRVKAVSPFLFTISWINGDESEIEIKEGDEVH